MSDSHSLESHKMKALRENIEFLRYECGMHESLVARRLGITVDNLRQIMRRTDA